MTRTKIIVTLGPSSSREDVVRAFIREGVYLFRINYSHGDPDKWYEYITLIRRIASEYGSEAAIIGDLPGPQIRIGDVPRYSVKRGDKIRLVLKPRGEPGEIPVLSKKFFENLDIGDIIILDDGRLRLNVEMVNDESAEAIAVTDGVISPHKSILIKGKEIELPPLSNRDIEAIKFSVENNIDYLALSYVRSSRDISVLRELIRRENGAQGVIAKIETKSAVERLNEIISVSDAVLVARGDLGMYYGLEEIPFLQKLIVDAALRKGRPVIIATQLLESMINSPLPTRSEVVDVVKAVEEHVDAVMLTSETAIGRYPVDAVRWLRKIIEIAESRINNGLESIRSNRDGGIREKYALGAVLLCESLGAKMLIYTKTGTMPSLVSRFRPRVPIYVGASDRRLVRKLGLFYGIMPLYIAEVPQDAGYDEGLEKLYKILYTRNEINPGDVVALMYGKKETSLNSIKIVQVL